MVGLVGGGGWRVGDDAAGGGGGGAVAAGAAAAAEAEHMRRLHSHAPGEHQCSSALVKHIKAPVHLVSSTTHDAFHPLFFFSVLRLVFVRLVAFGLATWLGGCSLDLNFFYTLFWRWVWCSCGSV